MTYTDKASDDSMRPCTEESHLVDSVDFEKIQWKQWYERADTNFFAKEPYN